MITYKRLKWVDRDGYDHHNVSEQNANHKRDSTYYNTRWVSENQIVSISQLKFDFQILTMPHICTALGSWDSKTPISKPLSWNYRYWQNMVPITIMQKSFDTIWRTKHDMIKNSFNFHG